MARIRQPLDANGRHHALKSLDRAATLLQSTRWWVAGALLLILLPLNRRPSCCGISVIGLLAGIAHWFSEPFEELAQDVRNRSARPLIIVITLVSLSIAGELLLDAWALLVAARAIRLDADDSGARILLAGIALTLTAATTWALWVFIAGWRAVAALKVGAMQGFDVIPADGPSSAAPPPPQYTLPPRPKR